MSRPLGTTAAREPGAWRTVLPAHEREIYAAAGYGRDAGAKERPALVIVDATLNFTGDRREPIRDSMRRFPNSCGEAAWDSIDAIVRLIDAARAGGVPIVYTHGPVRKTTWSLGGWARTTDSAALPEDDAVGESFPAEIQPRDGDIVLEKLKPSAFFGTPLASLLVDAGRDTVIVCGGTASGCVRATAIDAFSYGFRVCVIDEATFDRSETSRAVNLYEIDQKYGNVIPVADAVGLLSAAPRACGASVADCKPTRQGSADMTVQPQSSGFSLVALDPPGLPVPRGFSQTIAFGGIVLVSGQLPVDAERRLVGGDDPIQQARQVFRNLRTALEANGLGLQHLVKLTAFVVGEAGYEAFRTVRDELITPPFPTSTVGCVTEIVVPGAVVEIEAIAVAGEGRG